MSLPWIIVMIIGAIVMVLGLKRYKTGDPKGQMMAVAGAVIALLCALINLFSGGGPGAEKLRKIATQYREVKGEKVGQYLAENFSGQKAVIIRQYRYNPEENSDIQNAVVEGLKKGAGNKIAFVDTTMPEMPEDIKEEVEQRRKEMQASMPEDVKNQEGAPPEPMMYDVMPFEEWFTASVLDGMVEEYTDKCDIMILNCRLPYDIRSAQFWKEDHPKLVILRGAVGQLKPAIAQGSIIAAVVGNPDAEYERKSPPGDLDKAFAKRFILITPDNVKEISSKYDNIFYNEQG